MDKLELYPYGMDIIKNNKLLVAIERNEESKFAIVRETTQNFSEDKARVLKDFYMGEFDLHVEFVKDIQFISLFQIIDIIYQEKLK